MWLKLTNYNGELVRINSALIEAYGTTDENGALSYLSTGSGSYQVKESVEEIDSMMGPPIMNMPALTPEELKDLEKSWREQPAIAQWK